MLGVDLRKIFLTNSCYIAFLVLLFLYSNQTNLFAQPASGSVLINEVIIDSRGSSVSEKEYIELYSSQPNMSLAGLSIICVEGVPVPSQNLKPGDVIRRWDFPHNARTNQDGFFLIANNIAEKTYKIRPDIRFGYEERLTNEPQTIALIQSQYAPAVGLNVKRVSIPYSAVYDAVALTDVSKDAEFFFNAPVLGPDQTYLAAGATRTRDGVNTGDISDWALADIEAPPAPTYNTPGAPNKVGNSAVIIDAANVQADESVTSAPPQWNVFNPNQVERAIQQAGNSLVYVRSKKYDLCFQFENNYLLHPVAQPLLSGRPLYYMDVTDPGYGRLASQLGVYRVPSLAFKKKNGQWEFLVIRPETTGQDIYKFLQKK